MMQREDTGVPTAEVLKALGDPIRWNIMEQVAAAGELPCADLESTLPVSKPTISYHTKILSQARLLITRKQGRNYYYTLDHDALQRVLDDIAALAPRSAQGSGGATAGADRGRPAKPARRTQPAAAEGLVTR